MLCFDSSDSEKENECEKVRHDSNRNNKAIIIIDSSDDDYSRDSSIQSSENISGGKRTSSKNTSSSSSNSTFGYTSHLPVGEMLKFENSPSRKKPRGDKLFMTKDCTEIIDDATTSMNVVGASEYFSNVSILISFYFILFLTFLLMYDFKRLTLTSFFIIND